MKLSAPGEMDNPESESAPSAAGSGGLSDETVMPFPEHEEMDPLEAIELLGDMVGNPESFGIASESMVREAEERVEELEAENERLRRDLAVLWEHVSFEGPNGERAVPVEEGSGVGPKSVDVYDPTAEFDG